MARAADQVRSSDVTFWGLVALGCGAVAVLAANVSAVIPPNLLAGLHTSRLEAGTFNQLRTQVAALETDTARLQRENASLVARFNMSEEGAGVLARRIGAIEVALPDTAARAGEIDQQEITASIGTNPPVTQPADGGAIAVQQTPLSAPAEALPAEPLPAMPPLATTTAVASTTAIGVAIGPVVDASGAAASWRDLKAKIGTLLIGLGPVLGIAPDGAGTKLIAGPLDDASQAAALCTQLARVGIDCAPAPYAGVAIPD